MMEVHPYCELCDEDFPGTAEFTEHLRLVSGLGDRRTMSL